MGSMTIIKVNGEKSIEECDNIFSGQNPMRKRLGDIVGGDVEYVHVLYNGEPKYMVVNETGAIQDPPLLVNKIASGIYHTAAAKREGLSLDEAFKVYPSIHGDVVLLDGCELIYLEGI